MTTKERLDRLENAHRGLHARHEALMVMCRMLFPLVKADPALKQQITTRAYDVLNELMDEHGFDDEFQEDVRSAMDQLTKSILSDY
jgi:hypothetical protein